MPVTVKQVHSAKGVKEIPVHNTKSKKIKTKYPTKTATATKKSTVPVTAITKKSAPSKATTPTKPTTKNSTHIVHKSSITHQKNNTKPKRKVEKEVKIHPEVEKLVRMLTKLTHTIERTPAYDDDKRCFEKTDSDDSEDNSNCCSGECVCSDIDSSNSEDEYSDDSDNDSDSDDDSNSCSGCSTCGIYSDEFTVAHSTENDNDDEDSSSCSGCSNCCYSSECQCSTESDSSVFVAKLKKKPLKKRRKVIKSKTKPKLKAIRKTTKGSKKPKDKKPKATLKTDVKPAVNALQQRKTGTSKPVLIKKEPKTAHIKSELPSTSHAYTAPNVKQIPLKQSPKTGNTPPDLHSTMPKIKPKIEPITPVTLAAKPPLLSKRYILPKANSTFKKPLKKTSRNSCEAKIWRP